MFGMVLGLLVYVWLMIHRFRLAYAERALEARGLDDALAERRAEGDVAAPLGVGARGEASP